MRIPPVKLNSIIPAGQYLRVSIFINFITFNANYFTKGQSLSKFTRLTKIQIFMIINSTDKRRDQSLRPYFFL